MINLFTKRKERKREEKQKIAKRIQEIDINIASAIDDTKESCIETYELFSGASMEKIRNLGIMEREKATQLEYYIDQFINEYKYLENNYNNHNIDGLTELLEDRTFAYNRIVGKDADTILHRLTGYEFITEKCDDDE